MAKYKKYPKSKILKPVDLLHYGRDEVWGTLDGQYILIVNLRQSHLENIVRHLIESNREHLLGPIEAEIKRRKQKTLMKSTKAGKILYGTSKSR